MFVSASGDNLSYQWKKNGSSIAGATSAGLPLQNATGADEGNYTVVISNSEGNVTSAPIVVAVKMPAIPTGVYRINNSNGATGHEVALTGFSIDQHEVTKAFWDEVYAWAVANGYTFTNAGIAEGPEHPVHSINWYDSVKWANALSERDGHTPCYYTDNNCTQVYRTGEVDLTNYNVRWNVDGYRLPTESEWEVAARGGLEGSKYAWGESASTSKANFDQSLHGATLTVGSYPSTGYGLFEIGGNLREWTWDRNGSGSYGFNFKESFLDPNGTNNFIIDANTTAFWVADKNGYAPNYGESDQIKTDFGTDGTSWVIKKTFLLHKPTIVSGAQNELKGEHTNSTNYYADCKIKFFYDDETSQFSANQTQWNVSWVQKNYPNPSPGKPVTKIEIWLRQNYGDLSTEAFARKTLLYDSTGKFISLKLEKPLIEEESTTHFCVNLDMEREEGDSFWFELFEGDQNQTYTDQDIGKVLPLPGNITKPDQLRVYTRAKSSSPTIGATVLKSVYFRSFYNSAIQNPKGLWVTVLPNASCGTTTMRRDCKS